MSVGFCNRLMRHLDASTGNKGLLQDTVWAITPLKDDLWPELLARQAHASVFHRCGWLDVLRTTHDYEPVVRSN